MSQSTKFDSVDLLGVEVDVLTNRQAIDYITTQAKNPKTRAQYVVKPYVEFLDRAANDKTLRDRLNEADLTLADGVALTWAAAYLYAGPRTWWRFWKTLFQIVLAPEELRWPLPDRAAGINFTWPLLEEAALNQVKVYLVGKLTVGEIERTKSTITAKLPRLAVVGTHTGRDTARPVGEVSDDWIKALGADIAAAKPDLILVGMGFPLQEDVIARLAKILPHGVLIGEGGTFDYELFGGERPKAPEFWQRSGLEWFWRLLQEPGRIRRQLAVPKFIWRVRRAGKR